METVIDYNITNQLHNQIILCKKCNTIPIMLSITKKEKNIFITYECKCEQKTTKSLKDYLTELQVETTSQKEQNKCYFCQKDEEKTLYCTKCQQYICVKCIPSHQEVLPNHLISFDVFSLDSKCQQHKESNLLYYCKTCKVFLCGQCKSDRSHETHKLIKATEYNDCKINSAPFNLIEDQFEDNNTLLNIYKEFTTSVLKVKNSIITQINDSISVLEKMKESILESYQVNLEINQNLFLFIYLITRNYFSSHTLINENTLKNGLLLPHIELPKLIYTKESIEDKCQDALTFLKMTTLIPLENNKHNLSRTDLGELYSQYPPNENKLNVINSSFIRYFRDGLYNGEIDPQTKMRCGRGIYIYNNGQKYIGYWLEDKPHGKGKMIYPNGDYFEGCFYKGIENGLGKMKSSEGLYEGVFKNGLKDGNGKITMENGNSYEGQFKNNVIHGKGKYYWTDGNVYDGQWENGQRDGYGKLTSRNGYSYNGYFKQGKYEGQGIALYSNQWKAEKYIGSHLNNKKHGVGLYMWKDGSKYYGEFCEEKRHGVGVFYDSENKKWSEGIWDNNTFKLI